MQIKEFESPSLLPTLNALDAEFGCEEKRRGQRGAPMESTLRPAQPEAPRDLRAVRPAAGATSCSSLDTASVRPSLGKRALRRLTRFLTVFCVGAGSALAWQSYGDAARAMIAGASPQLEWLAPQTVPIVPPVSDAARPAVAALAGVQQLALGLAAVRKSVDQLTAQLTDAQQQTGGDIAKLQAGEQEILQKLSAAPPRPTAAPAHKPAAAIPPPSPSPQAH